MEKIPAPIMPPMPMAIAAGSEILDVEFIVRDLY
jgi:hypothetical protein